MVESRAGDHERGFGTGLLSALVGTPLETTYVMSILYVPPSSLLRSAHRVTFDLELLETRHGGGRKPEVSCVSVAMGVRWVCDGCVCMCVCVCVMCVCV